MSDRVLASSSDSIGQRQRGEGMTRRRPSPDDRVVVAAGSGWRLEWPIGLWAALSEDDRRVVVDRQTALLRKTNEGVTI